MSIKGVASKLTTLTPIVSAFASASVVASGSLSASASTSPSVSQCVPAFASSTLASKSPSVLPSTLVSYYARVSAKLLASAWSSTSSSPTVTSSVPPFFSARVLTCVLACTSLSVAPSALASALLERLPACSLVRRLSHRPVFRDLSWPLLLKDFQLACPPKHWSLHRTLYC